MQFGFLGVCAPAYRIWCLPAFVWWWMLILGWFCGALLWVGCLAVCLYFYLWADRFGLVAVVPGLGFGAGVLVFGVWFCGFAFCGCVGDYCGLWVW